MIPTHFDQLIGNETVKTYLTRMIEKKKVGHSLLFAGLEGVGKGLFASVLAAQLICHSKAKQNKEQLHKLETGHHPDVHIYRPEGKLGLHSLQSLRQLSEEVYLPPYEADWKVFIIHDADRMLNYSANALLKTFEEPPSHTIIILLSSAPASILPTILSRCRTVYFQKIEKEKIAYFLQQKESINEQEAFLFAQQSHGSLSRALTLARQKGDPNRLLLLNTLSKGHLINYKELTQFIHALVDHIENKKKVAESLAKEDIYQIPNENLSAQQQHQLEKELEGVVAMNVMSEVNALFEHLLSWYRDLHLLSVKGSSTYLINQDFACELENVLQQGNWLGLDRIQKSIDEARLALQRSTSLIICLENLFLKLGLV